MQRQVTYLYSKCIKCFVNCYLRNFRRSIGASAVLRMDDSIQHLSKLKEAPMKKLDDVLSPTEKIENLITVDAKVKSASELHLYNFAYELFLYSFRLTLLPSQASQRSTSKLAWLPSPSRWSMPCSLEPTIPTSGRWNLILGRDGRIPSWAGLQGKQIIRNQWATCLFSTSPSFVWSAVGIPCPTFSSHLPAKKMPLPIVKSMGGSTPSASQLRSPSGPRATEPTLPGMSFLFLSNPHCEEVYEVFDCFIRNKRTRTSTKWAARARSPGLLAVVCR